LARRTGLTRPEIQSSALAAGRKLIVKNGLKTFSMRQVASEIGYTVGTLYNVFKNQDDLLLQINARTLIDMRDFIQARLYKDLKGREILHSIATSYYVFAYENYAVWSTLFEYSLSEENVLPQWYVEKIRELAEVSEQAFSNMSLSKTDIKIASRTLWSSVHGICALALSGKLQLTASDSAEVLIDDLIDKYFKALVSK